MEFIFVISIHFIKYQFDRDAISFCGCKKTINKNSGSFGVIDGYHQHTLVEIGGKDVGLFGKIGRTADDVVLPIFYFVDKSSTLLIGYNLNTVSHGYGLVLRIPFNRKLPLILHSIDCPSSVFTWYQLPVFLITNPCTLSFLVY